MPGGDEGESLESEGHILIRGTGDNAWKIEHRSSGSLFQSMASVDAISGPRPSCVLADEIHEFKSSKAIQLWKAAIDKMSGDPLMILGTNTPGSDQIVGTEYSEMFQRIVKGDALDDTAFAFIARVDEGDDPFEDESCWQKSLPALNITFPVENVRTRVQTAKFLLSEALATKRLYFGIPVGSSGFWISEEAWRSAQGDVDLAKVRGAKCWASLDLSQKNDLTALTLVWDLNGHLYARSWYWTTKSGLADRERDDKVPYGQWVSQGHMEAVAGAVIDKEFVAAKLQELHAQFGIDFLAFDSAGMADFIAACERIDFPVWKYEGVGKPEGQGLKLVSHGQGTRVVFEDKALCMPRSVERLEDAILNSRITIQSNPVTTMCASNALVVADAMNNRAFDKKRSRGRIDGMVTLAMAVGASEMVPVDNGPSFWEVVS
jgi:phage terminase large subunit-like protein